ncbi:MAG: hypothetical protein WBR18_11360 [Anaerolineales bacterium]
MAKAEDKAIPKAISEGQRFEVGDIVEVLCDHEREDNRVRDWLKGTVIHSDRKMVGVQFTQDVYLTDGWMVPDRVLWLQQQSDNVRYPDQKKRG